MLGGLSPRMPSALVSKDLAFFQVRGGIWARRTVGPRLSVREDHMVSWNSTKNKLLFIILQFTGSLGTVSLAK